MLLQVFHWEEEPMENNGIIIYSKPQLSYNESAQPYHWAYYEKTNDCPERWIKMIGSLSFAILIEDDCMEAYSECLE